MGNTDNTANRVREYIEKRAHESASTQTILRGEIERHSGVFETLLGDVDTARRGVVGKEIQYISRRVPRERTYAVDGMLRMTDHMTSEEFHRLGGRGKPRARGGVYLLNPMFAKSDWHDYRVTLKAMNPPGAEPPKATNTPDPADDDFDINALF